RFRAPSRDPFPPPAGAVPGPPKLPPTPAPGRGGKGQAASRPPSPSASAGEIPRGHPPTAGVVSSARQGTPTHPPSIPSRITSVTGTGLHARALRIFISRGSEASPSGETGFTATPTRRGRSR